MHRPAPHSSARDTPSRGADARPLSHRPFSHGSFSHRSFSHRTPSRRSVLLGAGAGAAGLALAGCQDSGGSSDAAAKTPQVTISEFENARGDWTIWQVSYDLEDGESNPDLYTEATQTARHEALEAKKAEGGWTAQNPLLVLDPYGTTRTGLYVHFADDSAGELSFVDSVADAKDFAKTAANHAETGFEGLVVGLVPGATNTLALTWRPKSGKAVRGSLSIRTPTTASGYSSTISADVNDAEALTEGLFAMSGISGPGNNSFLMDNAGIMRAELASTTSAQHHLVVEDGRIVTTTGSAQVSVLDHLGHAGTIIDLGKQSVHHDLDVVGDAAFVLTSVTSSGRSEDRVTRVDLSTGEVEQVVDLQKVFPEYEKLAHTRTGDGLGDPVATGEDWIHINTLQIIDDVMYLSSRETSTAFALENALDAGSTPSVRWMLGAEGLWEGTGYEGKFLEPSGSMIGNAGQHSVHRVDDDSLPDGQFYLEMFNNNYWYVGTRNEADWKDEGPDNASTDELEGTSHMLRYLVDENTWSYTEDLAVEVPYSSVVSNVFRLGSGGIHENAVVNSGKSGVFSERDADGEVLASYRYDTSNLGYRVYKDTFEGFWYAAS